jgi:hypothetical protein
MFEWLKLRGWWLLWALLGAGLALRISLMLTYTPAVFNYYGGDSTRYMRLPFTGVSGLFDDAAMPAGYPAFLVLLREVWSSLPLTTMTQHLLGMAAAALLYAAVVRIGAPRWAALLPAVVVLFSGDQLFLEHGVFTEALWIPALALGIYLVARAIGAEQPTWWLAAGGAALGCSALVRHVSEVLPVLVAIWAALALPAIPTLRLRHAAAVLLPALAVIGVYFVVAKSIAGGNSGMVENQGFALYGRVGQFADCTEFTPPRGTAPLCVDTPPAQRPGPFFWTFSEESPIRTKIEFDPSRAEDQELLARFARQAILSQPDDYAWAVTRDFLRFFVPGIGEPRPESGSEAEDMSFASTVPTAQGASPSELAEQFGERYSDVGDGTASTASRSFWGGYQSLFRIGGIPLMLLVALAALGAALDRGPLRAGAVLFLGAGLTLLAFPLLFSSYDVRYAVPPIDLLSAGAAIGIAVLAARWVPAGEGRRNP